MTFYSIDSMLSALVLVSYRLTVCVSLTLSGSELADSWQCVRQKMGAICSTHPRDVLFEAPVLDAATDSKKKKIELPNGGE